MNLRLRQRVGAGVAFLVILGCSFLPTIFRGEPRCNAPTGPFSDDILVGTWEAGRPDQRDTLELRSDGTYRQSIHVDFVERLPLDYEGAWEKWRLEFSEEGIPYLHLDGFRFCGMNPAIPCEERDGDGHDVCRNEGITMRGEGILLVLETQGEEGSDQSPDYLYYLHYPLGSEDSWVYSLQE